MAYLTVTTQLDVVDPSDGQLSLREAVAQANASSDADTIRFVAALRGQTLMLTGGELAVTQDLKIDGGSAAAITIDGNQNGRVLNVAGSGVDLDIANLTLRGGRSDPEDSGAASQNGGAILLGSGSLTVTNSSIRDSDAGYAQGGGIFATDRSRVTVIGSTIAGNYARGGGGGICADRAASLTVRASQFIQNSSYGGGGAIAVGGGSSLSFEDSKAIGNRARNYGLADGGALYISSSMAVVSRSTIAGNSAGSGGGISAKNGQVTLRDSTIAGNSAYDEFDDFGNGGGLSIYRNSVFDIRNTSITNNSSGAYFYRTSGGGIFVEVGSEINISNSIVAGNSVKSRSWMGTDPDVSGTVSLSNGHNIFGSDVVGNIAGDRESVAASSLFVALDPVRGGGQLSPSGIVPLKNSLTNPALSAADPITAASMGQLGTTARPLPTGSLADLGSIEISQPLSTSPTVNNDVVTGSNAANNLSGLAGNDLIKGLGGADTLNGSDGSDVLDGGPGNDKLNGGTGFDVASFVGTTAVVVDLSKSTGTAKRGGETDQLTSIEGIIGSDKADTFTGSSGDNEFQGGLGKDTATGGGGRDLYAFRSVQDSPPGAGRDVITDFVPGQDVVDVSNLDADSVLPGQQTFRWVGKATLTGVAQLGYYVSGGNTIIRASTDASAAPEIEVQLSGVKTLTPGDFRF